MTKRTLAIAAATIAFVGCNNGGGGESSKRPATTVTVPVRPLQRQPPQRGSLDEDDMIYSDQPLTNDERRQVESSRERVTVRSREEIVTRRQPVQPAKTVIVPVGRRASECSEPFRENSALWFPGLPTAPLQTPITTEEIVTGRHTFYTDARQDGLFAFAVDRANHLPDQVQKASQDFAKQIRDVHIAVDQPTGVVKVQITYLSRMRKSISELRGQLNGRPTDVRLVQVPLPGQVRPDLNFAGLLTCADVDRGCKNIVLRLDVVSSTSLIKIQRAVFVVHRWGDAHITIADKDRRDFRSLKNPAHRSFAEYFSNTANNACLNLLADVSEGVRPLPACAVQRLQEECGGQAIKRPSARSFGLRSWAVAYGRSGFELTLADNSYNGVADFAVKRSGYSTIRGPLAYSATRTQPSPMWTHPLAVNGNTEMMNSVYLMNNDGGGNLNLRFDFKGAPESQMRVSVTSMLPNTRYSQAVRTAAEEMPTVKTDEVGDGVDQPLAEPADLK